MPTAAEMRFVDGEIEEAIKKHHTDCADNNDLKYMSKIFFAGSALTLFLTLCAGIAVYYKAEAAQDTRTTKIEVRVDQVEQIQSEQFQAIIDRLDKLVK